MFVISLGQPCGFNTGSQGAACAKVASAQQSLRLRGFHEMFWNLYCAKKKRQMNETLIGTKIQSSAPGVIRYYDYTSILEITTTSYMWTGARYPTHTLSGQAVYRPSVTVTSLKVTLPVPS